MYVQTYTIFKSGNADDFHRERDSQVKNRGLQRLGNFKLGKIQ